MAFNENLFVDIRSELLDRRLLFFHLLTFRSPSGRLDFFSIGFSTFLCERWQFFSCLRRRIQPNRLHTKTGKMDFVRAARCVLRALCVLQVPLHFDYH